jgi:cobalamin biosynthesis Mg chelatase CobN
MARKFNPFHDWLGFEVRVTKPSHFELFGVKPHSDDPIGFKKKIHSQAKILLKKLETMSPEQIGERAKLHTKMRRHIVKAHEILLDDELRAAYKKELRAKVREGKGNALATPPPKVPSAVNSNAEPRNKTERQSRRSKATKNKQPSPDKIPMAIPVSASAEKRRSKSVDEIAVKTALPKPKRSWAIFMACALMVLFCVAGVAALWMRFGNRFDGQSKFHSPAEQVERIEN